MLNHLNHPFSYRRDFLLLLIFLFSFGPIHSQIVNIESKRFLSDSNGWIGKTDIQATIIQNTQKVWSLGNAIHARYKKNKHTLLLLNDLHFLTVNHISYINTGFQHLRYSFKWREKVTIESFLQGQYNKLMKINSRYLAGAGPRFKLIKNQTFKLYYALAYLYEIEQINMQALPNRSHRLSTYLTFTVALGDHAEIHSSTFYQPNLQFPSDYRISHDNSIEIDVTKHLQFKTSFNLLYDTFQPIDVPAISYILKNGLTFQF